MQTDPSVITDPYRPLPGHVVGDGDALVPHVFVLLLVVVAVESVVGDFAVAGLALAGGLHEEGDAERLPRRAAVLLDVDVAQEEEVEGGVDEAGDVQRPDVVPRQVVVPQRELSAGALETGTNILSLG